MNKTIVHMCFDKIQEKHLKQLEKFKEAGIPDEYIKEVADDHNKVFLEDIRKFYNE